MLHFKIAQREFNEAVRVTCNKCGTSFHDVQYHPAANFTEIKKRYSFGSPKDGDKYISHICEACMDEFYATFKIPPQIVKMIVYGEESPDPVLMDAEPELA